MVMSVFPQFSCDFHAQVSLMNQTFYSALSLGKILVHETRGLIRKGKLSHLNFVFLGYMMNCPLETGQKETTHGMQVVMRRGKVMSIL